MLDPQTEARLREAEATIRLVADLKARVVGAEQRAVGLRALTERIAEQRCPTCGFKYNDGCEWVCAGCREIRALLADPAALHPACHASAPPGFKCSDCTMDKEPCPPCYAAWWQGRHPHVIQL